MLQDYMYMVAQGDTYVIKQTYVVFTPLGGKKIITVAVYSLKVQSGNLQWLQWKLRTVSTFQIQAHTLCEWCSCLLQ